MTGQRLMLPVVLMVMAGCESADRRAFNDSIDQFEANAAERAEIYESFEMELVAELAEVYGATAEDGCPQIEALPPVTRVRRTHAYSSQRQRQQEQQDLERRPLQAQARREAWERNVPGEHCRCLQGTIANVRSAIDEIDPAGFDEERARIADMSDEALAYLAASGGGPSANRLLPGVARERVAAWKTHRYEDWRGDADRWRESEERHGWEQYEPRHGDGVGPAGPAIRERTEPVLSELYMGSGQSVSCDRF